MKKLSTALLLLCAAHGLYAATSETTTERSAQDSTVTAEKAKPKVELPAKNRKGAEGIEVAGTKIALVDMTEVRTSKRFSERMEKVEREYRSTMLRVQDEERKLQEEFKKGTLTEAQVYGKMQELKYTVSQAEKMYQEETLKLADEVNAAVTKVVDEEHWDCAMPKAFPGGSQKCDITKAVLKEFEAGAKVRDAAEKFKKATPAPTTPATLEPADTKASEKPGIRPAPKKRRNEIAA
ncbi:MAG: hypothetical protein M1549_01350 [Candidatus Dependentiae bacterium]|nr:hypothetical protein [Candidatus Dependentiae bacterium]